MPKIDEVPMLRTSERRTFRRCPQRWWWSYRQGLTLRGSTPDALWFGTGWHLVMAHWYCGPGLKRGAEPLEVWRGYVGEAMRTVRTQGLSEEEWVDAGELGEVMLENYFNTYGDDPTWSVIEPERTFQIYIPHPKHKGKNIVLYVGTFDGAYRDLDDGKPWLMEHKTAKTIQTKHLPLDDQAGSYWAVATDVLRASGDIGPRETLAGITYNFARKGKPDERPRNADGKYTNLPKKEHYLAALDAAAILPPAKATVEVLKALSDSAGLKVYGEVSANQGTPLLLRESVYRRAGERKKQIERIQQDAQVMEAMRKGLIPVIKNTSEDCSFCEFYNMCLLHESGGDWQEFRDLVYTKRDPYADHRE